jgi:hypothetical protein
MRSLVATGVSAVGIFVIRQWYLVGRCTARERSGGAGLGRSVSSAKIRPSLKQLKPSSVLRDIAKKHWALSFAFDLGRGGRGKPSDGGETEMTEVFATSPGSAVPKIRSAARRSAAAFVTLAGLAMLASPIHGAFGAQTTQVRDVDDPGRIPYQSKQEVTATAGPGFQVQFPAVPAGHRLVIQHVSGSVNFKVQPSKQVEVFVLVRDGDSSFFSPFSTALARFDQEVQLYVDAGDGPGVFVLADSGLAPAVNGFLTLTGYLLDCTATPCAKIAK